MVNMTEAPDIPNQVIAEQTRLHLPSLPHWIEAIVEYLRQKAVLSGACQESRSGKLMVAFHEALSNAIVHGNLELSSDLKEHGGHSFAEALAQRVADRQYSERLVEVVIDCNQERCRWIVTDEGKGFDVEGVLNRKIADDPEEALASGRGILIMRSFLDEVAYELGGRRLVLTLRRESGQEKRLRQRVPVSQPLHVAPIRANGSVDWDRAYNAVSRDFSEEGVSLLQERLADTDRILLGITIDGRLVYVPAEVRHCRPLGGDVFELGCRFQQRMSDLPSNYHGLPRDVAEVHEAVNQLLAGHQAPPLAVDNRRIHQRVVFSERIEVLPKGAAEPLVAFARDLSRGGIAFVSMVPMPLDITSIYLPQRLGPPLRMRSQVVRCDRVLESFFDVGARFLRLDAETP